MSHGSDWRRFQVDVRFDLRVPPGKAIDPADVDNYLTTQLNLPEVEGDGEPFILTAASVGPIEPATAPGGDGLPTVK